MHTRPAVRPILVAAGLAVVVLAGCSSSGGDASPNSTTTTTTAATSTSTTTATVGRTSAPPLTGTTQPSGPPDGSGLKFRPVIGSQPCSSVTPDAPTDGPQSTATTIPDPARPALVPAADGGLCYGLGPVAATGEDLAKAIASQDSQTGQWLLLVTPKDAAKAKLNQLFDACNVGAATCPAGEGGVGAVAVELDGKVLSAPAVQAKGLASSPFQISGSFTQQQAQALAARLNG